MASDQITQTINQLKAARNILALIPSGANLDAAAAALAFKEFFGSQDKQIRILSPNSMPERFKFLPEVGSIQSALELAKNLVIEVSLKKSQLSELSYEKQDDKLSIFLTPKSGEFEPTDVNVKNSTYPFDLIVTFGVFNLEELGEAHAKHAQMFFEIPVVNIDHKASNENFGQINLVNLTASAVSELVFDLLNEYDPNFIDEKIATLLLAGLVFQTNSFQSSKTTPQVFMKASQLISLGGRQQEIITQLYRSKSLGLLRLWGRVLARLKLVAANQLAYSMVNHQDVEKSEATSQDLDEIITEMTQQLSFAKTFLFFVENQNTETTVYVATLSPMNLFDVFNSYHPISIGTQSIKFNVAKPMAIAETEITNILSHELV